MKRPSDGKRWTVLLLTADGPRVDSVHQIPVWANDRAALLRECGLKCSTVRLSPEEIERDGGPPAPKVGRPPLPPDVKRLHRFELRLTEAELSRLHALARERGVTPSDLLRQVLSSLSTPP